MKTFFQREERGRRGDAGKRSDKTDREPLLSFLDFRLRSTHIMALLQTGRGAARSDGVSLESRSRDELKEQRRLTLDQGLGESQRQRTKSSSETCT